MQAVLRSRRVDTGGEITVAGEPATQVFLVRSGVVELRRPADNRQTVLSTLREGGVFGDVPIFLGRPHHLDAFAASPVEVLVIDAEDLRGLIDAIPGLAARWLSSLAGRVRESHERLSEMLAGPLDHRVAAVLARRAGPNGRVDITQEQLARLLGVQRSSVNDAIRRLEVRRFVRRGYGHVTVSDPERLAALLRT